MLVQLYTRNSKNESHFSILYFPKRIKEIETLSHHIDMWEDKTKSIIYAAYIKFFIVFLVLLRGWFCTIAFFF